MLPQSNRDENGSANLRAVRRPPAVRLVTVDSPQLLRAVYRFRYQTYVEELHFDHPDAHHDTREMYDELDQISTIFALVDDRTRVVATLRCSVLSDIPDPRVVIGKFGLTSFIERFGLAALGTTSRFMFSIEHRRTANILKLIGAGARNRAR